MLAASTWALCLDGRAATPVSRDQGLMFVIEGIALTVVWECSRNLPIFWWGLKAKFYLFFSPISRMQIMSL